MNPLEREVAVHTVVNGLIIGMVIGVVVLAVVALTTKASVGGWAGWITVGLLLGVLCGGFGGIVKGSVNGNDLPQHRVVTKSQQLITLHQATGIEGGGWFLGWSVTDTSKYVYYVQTSNGVERRTINTDNDVNRANNDDPVYLVFDAPEGVGHIDTMKWAFDNPKDGDWALPKGEEIIQIHVPPDSIDRNFTVGS